MEPLRRLPCLRTLAALVPMGALALLALLPATAQADPRVLKMTLSKPPIVGRALDLRMRAVDPDAPVSGSVTTFGDGRSFGTSARAGPPTRTAWRPAGPSRPARP